MTLSQLSDGTLLVFTDADTGELLGTALAMYSEITMADIITDNSLFA